MSYYKLKDRIFHHSEKFKALIEAQDGVELMETEDYGWENYRYENDRFRLAHVERYSHMGLEVVHITCFPRESSKMPMFGFDVVGYQNYPDASLSVFSLLFDAPDIELYEQTYSPSLCKVLMVVFLFFVWVPPNSVVVLRHGPRARVWGLPIR